jgi:hypothetical protein
MKRFAVGLALVALAGCGSGGSSNSGAKTPARANPRALFITEIDAASLRNGYSDAHLLEAGDRICAAVRRDAAPNQTTPTIAEFATVRGVLLGIRLGDAGNGEAAVPAEDVAAIARIAARVLCPAFTEQINAATNA